ncbi:hypothetical protein KBB96_15020 [Luteolibacter ambystomatis]|uniref:Outer membrane beta-barrel protein n=1 Tax=Luteolibacter ambystomatis TaxID=2824561 RepID=A0A975IYA1_9BACT|nr:hypothetical protein [Luteolibacter ambystomatis]QUE50176.1 hypothetical protein KBB96_15020 [Luteolibacter ambystomatis]
MKRTLLAGVAGLSALGSAYGQGLYYAGSESQENSPLKWTVGINATYDDNVNPTSPAVFINPITSAVTPNPGYKESAYSLNPYVGVSFVSANPQTTWDVYGRLGLIYYLDAPSASGSEDLYTQARAGVNLTHRFNERLRLSSRSFVAYELEPDYAYGFASSRQVGEYFYWETDNSLGYRWTERLATYTGLTLSGLTYDDNVPNADRFTWAVYNQFRYQFTPQTVGTAEYRYSQTEGDGLASDATDQFILVGIEHRLSPNTIFVAKAGAQLHDVDSTIGDGSTTNPYFEAALNSQINTAFRVRAFARYSNENYDTVRTVFGATSAGPVVQFDQYEFTSRETLRLGVSADYTVSSRLSVFAGVDYIPASFDDGVLANNLAVSGPFPPGVPARVSGLSEDLVNAYIGLSVKFTDRITGDVSYNYTDSSSDLYANSYNRNRINVGVRAEF